MSSCTPAIIRFPNAVTLNQCLSNHALLNTTYFEEKGITKAIADLAGLRFADSDQEELGVKLGAMLLIEDLKTGIDGFTGEPLTNLGKLGLPAMVWDLISRSTEKALIDCAKLHSKHMN